jgi:hypothetical protein
MFEIILNLHIHTNYSDGSLPHKNVAMAAMQSGLDAILITDHNIRPEGLDGYYRQDGQQVLVMIGEEIHNPNRQPQKSHLLVFGVKHDLAAFADKPQRLIDEVNRKGGICFLAHPYDPALPAFGEDNISWVDWDVQGFTGIELWNGFSEIKVRSRNKWQAVFLGFFPKLIAHQPPTETLEIWDGLLRKGRMVVAIGGSDAHAGHFQIGALHKVIFPYEFHFSAINTHVLLSAPLSGHAESDSRDILKSLELGRCFIANDMPAKSHGFQFQAIKDGEYIPMGSKIDYQQGLKLEISLPHKCNCCLLKDGQIIRSWNDQGHLEYDLKEPGIYRVECFRQFLAKKRGWIFSNPLYIR